jgi:hypothetical protein
MKKANLSINSFKKVTVMLTITSMIAYDLQCSHGHTFEGWFEDSKAYANQKKKAMIACPVCNDSGVSRIPSTFAIKGSPSMRLLETTETEANLEAVGKQIVDYVHNNFDDVGCNFAKEALKIHYGAAEPRNIRGSSTKEEERTLKKEGIQFFKLPLPAQSDENN